MDPNEALRQIREAIRDLDEASRGHGDLLESAMRVADLVSGLDHWLSKGGFLPEAWQRKGD